MDLCPCGCGQELGSKPGQIYASRKCKDRVRNRLRYQRQKEFLQLLEKGAALYGKKLVEDRPR